VWFSCDPVFSVMSGANPTAAAIGARIAANTKEFGLRPSGRDSEHEAESAQLAKPGL